MNGRTNRTNQKYWEKETNSAGASSHRTSNPEATASRLASISNKELPPSSCNFIEQGKCNGSSNGPPRTIFCLTKNAMAFSARPTNELRPGDHGTHPKNSKGPTQPKAVEASRRSKCLSEF